MNYKTRSDVLGTIDPALRIFLNESVAAITSRSDFTLGDLRGARRRITSLYIVVPQQEARHVLSRPENERPPAWPGSLAVCGMGQLASITPRQRSSRFGLNRGRSAQCT